MNTNGAFRKILVHMIKTFPSARLNAGESGEQKTGELGGVLRARLSGANIAYGVRHSQFLADVAPIGIRSRSLPQLVLEELYRMKETDSELSKVEDEFLVESAKKLTKFGQNKADDKNGEEENDKTAGNLITNQSLFFTETDVRVIADVMRTEILKADDIESFKALSLGNIHGMIRCVNNPISVDMALFGRMVTSDSMLSIESAVQIANALSTHAVHKETDYFVCVDDIIASGASSRKGTSLIQNKDFNGSCFYEYTAIDLNLLEENLQHVASGDTLLKKVVNAYISAFVYTYSRTQQSRFAAQVFPDMVYVEVQESGPAFSYVNAFSNPIPTFGDKPEVTKKSVEAFSRFVNTMARNDIRTVHGAYFSPVYPDLAPDGSVSCEKFTDILEAVDSAIDA